MGLLCTVVVPKGVYLDKQAPFGTASQSSAARVRGSVEMLRTCEVHSSKPSSNETLCQRAGRLTDENMWQF